MVLVFGLPRPEIKFEFIVLIADALPTQTLTLIKYASVLSEFQSNKNLADLFLIASNNKLAIRDKMTFSEFVKVTSYSKNYCAINQI